MKKTFLTLTLLGTLLLGACQKNSDTTASGSAANDEKITVVSREEGSGTRGAFIELFGIEEANAAGKKEDHTLDTAEITNSTSVMMTTITSNPAAIGYVSMGSLNNEVKALDIDKASPTPENVKNGSYTISRPFNIVQKNSDNPIAEDFIAFILSSEGQKVVTDNHYISKEAGTNFTPASVSGKLTIAGSSSVTPLMEKLKEAYNALNSKVTIEIQQSDSTTGITSAKEGLADIGMASRELKESESDLKATVIALDGIAVVVNKDQKLTNLTKDQVKQIYTGELTTWGALAK